MALSALEIEKNPKFQELVSTRKKLGWSLTVLTLVIYFGFILLYRLRPEIPRTRRSGRRRDDAWHADRPGGHHRHFLIVGVYVMKANATYDDADPRKSSRRASDVAHQVPSFLGRSPASPPRPCPVPPSADAISGQRSEQEAQLSPRSPCSSPSSCSTLGITYWAAKRTRSAAQFYSAGGGITGFQNGLAIAGDYMSAASFLGISGLVYLSGYDGLIYSVGFLVGWPIVTFLIAEPLRNLGKFTFADVASFRFQQTPIRVLAACGTLVMVAFYLIAQMVGAGKLIQLLFGLDYCHRGGGRRRADDHLCDLRRHGGDDLGADHQGLPAARRRDLHGLHGHGPVRLQPRGPVRQGGRSASQASGDHGARNA